jgi:hypothetical protein
VQHYTDDDGFKAIDSQVAWLFKAAQPPGDHPRGAYFTTLGADATNLALRLRIPTEKTRWFFSFVDVGDLKPLEGGRGRYIFYSPHDYVVGRERQLDSGRRPS